jgi:acyl CoA:acetate/3-ketoacid CoA transferase alpha subunit
MRSAIAEMVPDGASVALGLQMEQMIPFAAGHEIIRQKRRGLTLIGPISDILFDQLIGAGCAERFKSGEPIQARPPSTAYRISKKIRKHAKKKKKRR